MEVERKPLWCDICEKELEPGKWDWCECAYGQVPVCNECIEKLH